MAKRDRPKDALSAAIRSAWIVDYVDGQGVRRQKKCTSKKDADNFAATANVEVREGTHVADSASVTVKAAGDLWIAAAEEAGLERSTVDQYRQHLNYHIAPFIGATLLSKLNVPKVRDFESTLRKEGRSAAMVKKVVGSLGGLIGDAQERGLTRTNPVRDMRGRRRGKERKAERRQKAKLRIGVDIPTPAEMKTMIGAAIGDERPLILTAALCGLRASELRGLPWAAVNFDKRVIHVRERADRYNAIGRPKSEAGERDVPMPPVVYNGLREWQLAYPRPLSGEFDADGEPIRAAHLPKHYVFPNGLGKIESHANIINRVLCPVQERIKLTVPAVYKRDKGGKRKGDPKLDKDGNQKTQAKYTGMHALRHFFASWCINPKSMGGLELPPKVVQERMGHSSITMTMDTYGHLFPRHDDGDELAAGERALLG
jgi:integrase